MGETVAGLVACYVFSLVILCLSGLLWVRGRRLARVSQSLVERMKLNLQLSRGSRNARKRMWLRELRQKGKDQRKWQGRSAYNRLSPPPGNAKKRPIEEIQRELRLKKQTFLKFFGGRK